MRLYAIILIMFWITERIAFNAWILAFAEPVHWRAYSQDLAITEFSLELFRYSLNVSNLKRDFGNWS